MEILKTHSTLSTESTIEKNTIKPIVENNTKTEAPALPINISDDWVLIEKNIPQLQKLNDVDMAKVNALQESLKQGDFKIDLSLISEKMINQHG